MPLEQIERPCNTMGTKPVPSKILYRISWSLFTVKISCVDLHDHVSIHQLTVPYACFVSFALCSDMMLL